MLKTKTKQHKYSQSKQMNNHILPENIRLDLSFRTKNGRLSINKLQGIS